jgi:methyltransferase-like protein 6
MQPVLDANPDIEEYIASDVSQTAIDILQRDIPPAVKCQQWDATQAVPASLPLETTDCVLMVFALSAIRPEHHVHVLRSALALLRPGGLLCFRDYGLYDMTMLRHNKQLGDRWYLRAEGTLAYYFDLQHTRETAVAAGFEVLELEYCTVNNVNRRKGTVMRRVFVHAKLQKPVER